MRLPPAPIRFVLLVVGGWIGLRATMLLLPPGPETQTGATPPRDASPRSGAFAAVPRHARSAPSAVPDDARPASSSVTSPRPTGMGELALLQSPASPARPSATGAVAALPPLMSAPSFASPAPVPVAAWTSPALVPQGFGIGQRPAANPASRVSASAWLFVRERGEPGLAPGGTLGGSQAGARLTYRLNGDARRPVSLSGRVYAPLDRPEGAEAAAGIDWRPIAGLPINLLTERRQRLGREGRSDFALTVYGGTEARLLRGRVRVEAYGQAGIVGVEERDLFADGSIVATTRIGPIDVGGGAWGGAQPGVARLDLGPHASFRLPVGRATIRAAAEWRFRVAGDAEPASGPALTISAGF